MTWHNGIFLEEVVTNPPSTILDGAIYSIFGVFDYYFYCNVDPLDQSILISLLDSLESILHSYDFLFWSNWWFRMAR